MVPRSPIALCAPFLWVAFACAPNALTSSGSDGQNGVAGSNGARGSSGPTGPAGAPGATGAKGDKGDAGAAGQAAGASGTRLKVKTLTAADGFVQVNYGGLRDTKRNEDCYFALAGDDKLRCLPYLGAANFGGSFADAGCTQPVAAVLMGTCTTALAYKSQLAAGCPTQYRMRIHTLGTKRTGDVTLYQGSPSSCSSFSPSAAFDYYNVGAEIAATEFVEGAVTF